MKYKKLLLLSLVLAFVLTSCDVFYSSLSGTIYDSDSRDTPLSGVQVYGYTDKGERDSAYSSWESKGGIFRDDECLFRSTTNNQGSWTISKIVWDTGSSKWGKDFDHKAIYLIYFSEPYGCWKSDAIEVISSANNTAVTEYRSKVMKDSTLTLSFKDSNSSLITDDINFTYEYNNGYRDIKNNESTRSGSLTLSVSYINDNTKVKISKISTPDKTFSDHSDVEVTLNAQSIKEDVTLTRVKYVGGFSGNINANKSYIYDAGGALVNPIDGLTVELIVDDNVLDSTLSSDVSYNEENQIYFQSTYSSLGSGKDIPYNSNETKVTIRVYKNKKNGNKWEKDDSSYIEKEIDLNKNNTRSISFTF